MTGYFSSVAVQELGFFLAALLGSIGTAGMEPAAGGRIHRAGDLTPPAYFYPHDLNRIVLFDRGVVFPLNRNVIVHMMRSRGPLDTHMVLPKGDQGPAALHDPPAQQLDLIGSQILFRFEAGNLPGTGGLSHSEYKFFGAATDGHFCFSLFIFTTPGLQQFNLYKRRFGLFH